MGMEYQLKLFYVALQLFMMQSSRMGFASSNAVPTQCIKISGPEDGIADSSSGFPVESDLIHEVASARLKQLNSRTLSSLMNRPCKSDLFWLSIITLESLQLSSSWASMY